MPKPQHHVFVCVQQRPPGHPRPSCGAKGSMEIAEEFYNQLQQRQAFDKVAVSTSSCFGPCDQGPTVLVYPEGVMYAGVTRQDVAEIFDQHLERGDPVARLRISEAVWG